MNIVVCIYVEVIPHSKVKDYPHFFFDMLKL